MRTKRLNTKNKLFTPGSNTTVYIDYSPKEEILEVEFSGGKIYHYFEVKPTTWKKYKEEVLSGGSSGQFVNWKIKPVFQKFRQIT